MALVPYVAAAVPTEEEELIGRLSSALLAWLPEDNGLPLIELDYSDEQAIEKVTLACVERYFGLLVEFVNITRSAEPIDPRVLAGTFFHADKLCRFQLTAAHGERASRRVTSEEAEKLHMIWRYAYRQYLRTPDSSRSAKLMRLKATMFRYEPRSTVRDRPAIYPDRLPRRSEPPLAAAFCVCSLVTEAIECRQHCIGVPKNRLLSPDGKRKSHRCFSRPRGRGRA